MKRLHLFTNEFPFGAQETFLEAEIRVLAARGFELTIHPLFDNQSGKRDVAAKVSAAIFKKKWSSLKSIIQPLFWYILWLGLIDSKNIRQLLAAAKQALIVAGVQKRVKKIDKQESIFYFYWGTDAANIIITENLNHIIRFHGYDLYESDQRLDNYNSLRSIFIKRLKRGVFISDHGLNYFRNRYPTKASLKLFRLGVENRGIAKLSGDGILRILSISNVVKVKRLHLLVEALAMCQLPIEWTHIGDGPLLNEIKEFASKSAPHIRQSFLGRKSNRAVHDYFCQNEIDLFVNVSQSEGAPVSIMEALMYGVPVIAPAVGGIPELIEKNFLLQPNFSPADLRDKIYWFFKTDYKKTELRSQIRKIAEANLSAEANYGAFADYLTRL